MIRNRVEQLGIGLSFKERHPKLKDTPDSRFPQRAALVPDKNRTTAMGMGLPSIEGYSLGTKRALIIFDEYADAPIKSLFVWTSSIDNLLKRKRMEKYAIARNVGAGLMSRRDNFKATNRKFTHVGSKDPSLVPQPLLNIFSRLEEETYENTGQEIQLGFAYGEGDHRVRSSQRFALFVAQLIRENPYMTDEQIETLVTEDFIKSFYDVGGNWTNVHLLLRTYYNADAIKSPQGNFFKFHLSEIGEVHGPKTAVYAVPTPFPLLGFDDIDSAILDYATTERPEGK